MLVKPRFVVIRVWWRQFHPTIIIRRLLIFAMNTMQKEYLNIKKRVAFLFLFLLSISLNESHSRFTIGEKFHFVSQLHYDALGEIIGIYVQKKLIEFGLKEVLSSPLHLIWSLFFPLFFFRSFRFSFSLPNLIGLASFGWERCNCTASEHFSERRCAHKSRTPSAHHPRKRSSQVKQKTRKEQKRKERGTRSERGKRNERGKRKERGKRNEERGKSKAQRGKGKVQSAKTKEQRGKRIKILFFFFRAGQWARSLCINESLSWGTILPYLKK